jgi:hypothetical protein
MSDRSDLIRRPTRTAFRRLCVDIPLAALKEFWEDRGFEPAASIAYEDTNVRRLRFESYAASVNWSDQEQVDWALRVLRQCCTTHAGTSVMALTTSRVWRLSFAASRARDRPGSTRGPLSWHPGDPLLRGEGWILAASRRGRTPGSQPFRG